MLKIKYKTTLLIIFCLLVLSLQVISAQSLPLQDTIIMVDPGHGGRDSGTYYDQFRNIKTTRTDINRKRGYRLYDKKKRYRLIIHL